LPRKGFEATLQIEEMMRMISSLRLRSWLVVSLVWAMTDGLLRPAWAADKPVLKVFLLAGQSNMAGADSVVPDPPGFQSTAADRATRFTMAPLPDGAKSMLYVPWGEICQT